jgi:hypothetical protein
VILISFNLWLEYYLRKSLEQEFNKSLNAIVTIGNVDMKFLSGQIVIEDFVLVGKNEFSKDTLISCGSIIAEPGEFDSKTSTLNFKRLIADNLTIKTVIVESGKSNWDNLIVEQDSSNNESAEQTKLFLEKLIITDGLLEYEDRTNKTFFSLRDIDLVMSFTDDSTNSTADFNFNAAFFKDSVNFVNLKSSGNLKNNESETNLDANLFVGKIPVKINATIPNDSLKNTKTRVEALADFDGLSFSNSYSSGFVKFNLNFADNYSSGQLEIEADSLEFSEADSSSVFFANFKFNVDFKMTDRLNLLVELRDCFILSNSTDTLSGKFLLNLSESNLKIESGLNGKIDIEIPFSNFGDFEGSFILKTQINSDLNYFCDAKSENSEGQLKINSRVSNPYFKISELEMLFVKNNFSSIVNLNSRIFNAKIDCEITDFLNYFNAGTIKGDINFDLDRIIFPSVEEDTNSFTNNIKFSKETVRVVFPKSFELNLLLNIDTISIDDFHIYKFANQIVLSPELISFKSDNIEIGKGTLQYELNVSKEENDTVYYSMFKLRSFDLAYFSKKDSPIEGILEVDFENTLYNYSSDMQNSGLNVVSLKGFKKPVSFLKEYGIEESSLTISDFDMVADLYSDSIKIQPFTLNVNMLQTAISGSYNYSKDDISISILLDAPETYLSPEIKIALAVFSEKSAVKLPKKKGRIIKHLKIAGSMSKPSFVIFE